jgi:galactose-1-phosphate uridylyltransferase
MTIREIRRVLFDTNLFAVIGPDEMTNKEARDYFYAKTDQEKVLNVIENGNHLLVWER